MVTAEVVSRHRSLVIRCLHHPYLSVVVHALVSRGQRCTGCIQGIRRRSCRAPGCAPDTQYTCYIYPKIRKESLVVYSMQEDIVIIATPFHPVKWGSFIARGLLALIIGILVLIWTGIAVQVVVTLIGILIILAAILALVLALKPRRCIAIRRAPRYGSPRPARRNCSYPVPVDCCRGADSHHCPPYALFRIYRSLDCNLPPGVYTAPVPACFFRGNLDNSRRGIFLPAGIRCDRYSLPYISGYLPSFTVS